MKRSWLMLLTAVLPVMLIFSALRTYSALDEQRAIYLRSRAAALAARLETLHPSLPESQWTEALSEEEPAFTALAILDRGDSAPQLEAIWEGRELFRSETVHENGAALYRTYVPFHTTGGAMRIARIDLEAGAADFLVDHARHHLWLVVIGGAAILVLSQLNARSNRRAAEAEKKQLALTHLAHIGEMSAVLAHEIRNPLGTIKGYAQLLGEKLHGEHSALLAPILSETRRLEALVRDLLLYGRPAQPVSKPVESGDLAALLRQHAQQARGVDVQISLPAFTLQTDPGLLEQILLNLLRNSIDAVKDAAEPRVSIDARVSSTGVDFVVSDSGPGFSEESLRRLFEPFFTTKASGTGLGLCVSRKLAEVLGGTLQASNGSTGGARIQLRLPLENGARQ